MKGEVVFENAFEKAALATLNQSELHSYEDSLKVYRDLKNVIDTARDEGKLEGKTEVAKALKDSGIPLDIISKSTGLSKKKLTGYSIPITQPITAPNAPPG